MAERNRLVRVALALATANALCMVFPAEGREVSIKLPLSLSIEPDTLSITETWQGNLPSVTYESRTVEETRMVGGHRNHPSVVEMIEGWAVKEHTTHNGEPVTIYARTVTKDIAIEGEPIDGRLSIEVNVPVAPEIAGTRLRGTGGEIAVDVSLEGFDGADPARIEEQAEIVGRTAEAKLGQLLQVLADGAVLADEDLADLISGEPVVIRLTLGPGTQIAFQIRGIIPDTYGTDASDRPPVEE